MGSPLLIDGNSLIKRCILTTALDDMKAGGVWTGGVHGMLQMLASMLEGIAFSDVTHVVAFFDAGVPEARMKAIPGYKAKREERKLLIPPEAYEKAMSQMATCRTVLGMLGVQCLSYKNREADDCCAAASMVFRHKGATPIIVSGDKDQWQCIEWGARVWYLGTKAMITAENFEKHSGGVPLAWWLVYKTLLGDASDNLAGSPGAGPKKALEIVQAARVKVGDGADSYVKLNAVFDAASGMLREDGKPVWCANMLASKDRLRNELAGVDLHESFGDTTNLSQRIVEVPPVKRKDFLSLCHKLKLKRVLGDPERYVGPFVRAHTRIAT